MLGYYIQLAWRSLRSSPALSVLMVLALGLGIGACMTTLTVYHALSGDPIPHKSARLFDVQIDAASKVGYKPGDEPSFQLTRFDAEALLRAKRGQHQVMMTGAHVVVQTESAAIRPLAVSARYTSSDFFAMFEKPFLYGSGWDEQADNTQARVVVISQSLNQKLFAGRNSVGQVLLVRRAAMRIIGVLKEWPPELHFYDLTMSNSFTDVEDLYMPFATATVLKLGSSGSMECWDAAAAGQRDLNATCAWIQYWVQLASAADAPAFRQYLVQYSEEQRRAGRFERPANVRLRNVTDWLVHRQVLPGDVRLQLWLALGFLLVCLTNTVGLLLAKCLRRSGDIGVRRALGATRGAIFAQFLVESMLVGVAGGLLGLLLATLGLWLVRQSPAGYAALAQMDWAMLATTLVLSLAASALAGLLPAWRASGVLPAQQLKAQ